MTNENIKSIDSEIEKKLISNENAMKILSIQTKAAMSKLAKKEKLNRTKKGKEIFYYEDDILALREFRETNPYKRSSSKRIAIAKKKFNKPIDISVYKTQPEQIDYDYNAQEKAIIQSLKDDGLFLHSDTPLIESYAKAREILKKLEKDIQEKTAFVDNFGKERLTLEFESYLKLSELQLKREKALGIGAGNRKGIDTNPIITINEMDDLIDG